MADLPVRLLDESIGRYSVQSKDRRHSEWCVTSKYEIVNWLGSGAYGEVAPPPPCCHYRYSAAFLNRLQVLRARVASDPSKTVVIKRTNIDPGSAKCTLREIAIMRRLNHPNIVKILDILEPEAVAPPAVARVAPGEAFKKLYVVLEDGGMDLKAFIAQQYAPLALEVIQGISRQICAALAYLHSCRVVHRDLKPANILIDPQTFHVRIADFGLSRAVELPADTAPPAPPTPPTPPSHLGIRKSTSEANFFARMCSSSEFRTVAGEDGPHACVQMGVEHMTLGNDFQTNGAGAMLASPRTRACGRGRSA
jgi:hypothetical protein